MKIRGNVVGTPLRPDKTLVKATNLTEEEKAHVRANIGAVAVGEGGGSSAEIEQIKKDIADIQAELSYEPISITSFSCTGAGTYEIGTVVPPPTVSWALNKEPASQTLNNEAMGTDARSKEYTESVTSSKTYKLIVTDEKGAKAEQSAAINIYHGMYYGALEYGAVIDNAAILGMTRKLQSKRDLTFTVTPGEGKRPAYALPSSGYGTPIFKIGGFEYEWEKVAVVEEFTNDSGHTESYDVWMHGQDVAGSVTVNVT